MDDETRRESARLADELRRIINRLAVVRPSAEALRRAADAAAAYADSLEGLPGRSRAWEVSEAGLLPRDFVSFSPLSGSHNPIAPPISMRVIGDEDGTRIEGTVTFGPAYEGPPGHVHGGFVAAMFDELLGFAQMSPGFTAYLHVDYRKPTPLSRQLDLSAAIDRTEGRKRWVRGTCHLDGLLLSEAEGLFVGPREDQGYLELLGVDGK